MAHYKNRAVSNFDEPIGGAMITVFAAGTRDKVKIFADAAMALEAENPMAAQEDGSYEFYTAKGNYDIEVAAHEYAHYFRQAVAIGAAIPVPVVGGKPVFSSFVSLTDTPADFVGAAGKLAAVNAAGSGMEFVDPNTVDALGDLSDVTIAGATAGQALVFQAGGGWKNAAIDLSGKVAMTDLSDVLTAGLKNGDLLSWNGTKWQPQPPIWAVSVHNHDGSYYKKSEVDTLLAGKLSAAAKLNDLADVSSPAPTVNDVLIYNATLSQWESKTSPFSPLGHTHTEYYPRTAVDGLIAGRLPTTAKLMDLADVQGTLTGGELLSFNRVGLVWTPQLPTALLGANFYTKTEVDTLISAIGTGTFRAFADMAARNALPTAGLAVGTTCVTANDQRFYVWDGTAWQPASGVGAAAGTDYPLFMGPLDLPSGNPNDRAGLTGDVQGDHLITDKAVWFWNAVANPAKGWAVNTWVKEFDVTGPASADFRVVGSAVARDALPAARLATGTTVVTADDQKFWVWAGGKWNPAAGGGGGGGVSAPPSLRSLVDTALHPGYPADGELLTWVDADKKWEGVPFDDSRFIWANLPTETLPDVGMTVGSLRSLTQGVSYQFPTVHVDPHGADLGFDRAKVEHIGILDEHVQDAYLYKLTDEQYIVQMRDHKASLGHRIYPKFYTLDLSPDWPNGTGLTATGPVGFRNSDQEALDIIGHRSLFGGLTIAQKVNEIEGQLAGHNNKAQTPTDGVVELGIGPQPTIGLLEDNNAGTNFWDGKEYLVSFSYKAGESAATIHDNFSLWIEVGTEYKRFIDRNDGAVIKPMVIKHFIDAGTLVKIEYNPAEGRLELVEVEHQVSSTAVTFLKSDGSTPFQPVDSALAPNLSLSVNPADQLIYKTGTGVVLPILTIASGLGELAKVTLTNPADKEVLTYDATADGGNGAWVNKAPAAGAGGATTLDSLTDVSIDAPNLASDQVLKYDPTANSGAGGWVNAAGGAASFDYLSHSPQVPVALPTTPVGTNAIIKLGKPTEVTDHHLLTNSFTDAVGGPGNNWLEVKHWEQSAAMHCVWLSAWETGVDLFGTGTALPPSPKVLVIGPSLPTQPIPNIGGLAAVFTGDIILDGTHSLRATNWNFDGVNARFVGATVDLTNAQIDFSNAHLSELKINLLDDVVIDYGTMAAGHVLTAFNNGGTWGFRNEPVLASINDLTDVDTHTQPPKDHEVLTWIAGIGWHPHSLASHPVTPGAGVKQLDDLDDVNIGSPTAGEILVYDDTLGMWMNQIPGVPEPPAPPPPAPALAPPSPFLYHGTTPPPATLGNPGDMYFEYPQPSGAQTVVADWADLKDPRGHLWATEGIDLTDSSGPRYSSIIPDGSITGNRGPTYTSASLTSGTKVRIWTLAGVASDGANYIGITPDSGNQADWDEVAAISEMVINGRPTQPVGVFDFTQKHEALATVTFRSTVAEDTGAMTGSASIKLMSGSATTGVYDTWLKQGNAWVEHRPLQADGSVPLSAAFTPRAPNDLVPKFYVDALIVPSDYLVLSGDKSDRDQLTSPIPDDGLMVWTTNDKKLSIATGNVKVQKGTGKLVGNPLWLDLTPQYRVLPDEEALNGIIGTMEEGLRVYTQDTHTTHLWDGKAWHKEPDLLKLPSVLFKAPAELASNDPNADPDLGTKALDGDHLISSDGAVWRWSPDPSVAAFYAEGKPGGQEVAAVPDSGQLPMDRNNGDALSEGDVTMTLDDGHAWVHAGGYAGNWHDTGNVYPTTGGWINQIALNPIPAYTVADATKVLSVDAGGQLAWQMPAAGGGGGGLVHTMPGATGVVRGTPRTQLAGEVGVSGYTDMGASISYTGAYVAGGNTPTPLHHTQYLEVEIWLSDSLVSDIHPDDSGTIRDFYFFADKRPLFIGQPDLIETSLREGNKNVGRTKDALHLLEWGPELTGDEADPDKWLITQLVSEARPLAPPKRINWIFDANEGVIGMKMIRPVEFEHPEWGIDWQVKWQVLTLRGPVSEGAPA